jgi:hypothetical protein
MIYPRDEIVCTDEGATSPPSATLGQVVDGEFVYLVSDGVGEG